MGSKWDIESPRFAKACTNLGYLPTELKLIPRDDFERGAEERSVVTMRFRHHQKTLTQLLNDVIGEREKIRIDWIIRKSRRELGMGGPTGGDWEGSNSPSPTKLGSGGNSPVKEKVLSHNRQILLKK